MRSNSLIFAVCGCMIAFVVAQTSFVGSDFNGNPVTCVNGVCENDKGDDCDLMTVSCWDWRCRNTPSRFLCALTDACLTVVCYDPAAAPTAATRTPAPVRNDRPFDFDNCDGKRERKELRCLDNEDRANFVLAFMGAVKAGVASDFTQMFDTNVWEATGGAKFFPWIRYYLRRFENILREIEPKFKAMPYWDFTSDSNDIALSEIFNMKNGMSKSREGKCIVKPPWKDYYPTYPEKHCIHRGFTAGVPNRTLKVDGTWGLDNLVNHAQNYSQFTDVAEYVWHRVRQSVGGEMAKRIGPNDPLFYLLLANMDRYWMMRQNREDVDAFEYNGDHRDGVTNAEDRLAAFGGNKIKDVLETKCISYAPTCTAHANPEEAPINLWESYMEKNVLPKGRIKRVESFVQNILTNSHGADDEALDEGENTEATSARVV